MPDAFLFDLDGTLADTAPDLGACANALLAEHGRLPKPLATLRPHTSSGVRGMLREAFGIAPDDPDYPKLAERFLVLYEARLCVDTRLFDGIAPLLAAIERSGRQWGIVTNKRTRYTLPLVDRLGLSQRAACVVSGDTTAAAKPSPLPLLHACEVLGVAAQSTVYVGDDVRDVQAGKAAGCTTVAVRWGYLGVDSPIENWGADWIIEQPEMLLSCALNSVSRAT